MDRANDLTSGDIKKVLTTMALPLMGVAFVQMTYNLVDMFWLGRHSSEAVAAVGTAGLVNYIANSIAITGRVGSSTWIAQSFGKGDRKQTLEYIENGLVVNIFLALIMTLVAIFGRRVFLSFFELSDLVYQYAESYIFIIGLGFIITFLNPIFAAAYNSIGNSITPFKISIIGLGANFILDPLFIYGLDMGVAGAALATVLAQGLVLVTYIFSVRRSPGLLSCLSFFSRFDFKKIKRILNTGWPASLQSTAQAIIATVLNTFISRYGPVSMAVYTLGVQIESICWMSADGFAIAMTALMGQNLGARKYDRIDKGYIEGMKIFFFIGLIASLILFILGETIFSLFMPGSASAIEEGKMFLRVLAISEIPMALEIGTNGSFSGLGLTKIPATTSLLGNLIRIPIAIGLMPRFGVAGIWIAVSTSMALKGLASVTAYQVTKRKTNEFKNIKELQ